MVEVAVLPQSPLRVPRVCEAGELLGRVDVPLQIAVRRTTFDQQVDVIGHEAVRDQRESVLFSGSQNLRQHEGDGVLADKCFVASRGAQRQ